MEYVLLIHADETAYAALDEETGKAMYAEHFAFMDEARAAGVTIAYSAELDEARTGRVVGPGGLVTDGPYAEAKEQLGGFYVLDVPGIEDAVEWAKKIPMLPTDAIEVRPGK
ncbi:MAG TPA: YciI family protein [Mycobacteriales bacterium]|nr:YciI family protein [Mycobacteriales bacterium]